MAVYASAIGPLATAFGFAAFTFGALASGDDPPCDPFPTGKVCECELTKLKPLQGSVGMAEVEKKAHDIADDSKDELKDLRCDPIKLVVGANQEFYITDHHHTALAWLRFRRERGEPETGLCMVQAIQSEDDRKPLTFRTESEFWTILKNVGLVHLENEKGLAMQVSDLPQTLDALAPNDDPYRHDDPYRSLAWMVRKEGGLLPAA